MSKTQLRKELKNFDREQVAEILLDVYQSCKEAREYLDFFLDPDVDKLYQKHLQQLEKEIYRGKYGRCTARVSYIRRIIRKFDSFGTGPENTLRMMEFAAMHLVHIERVRHVGATIVRGTVKLLCDMLVLGERNMLFDKALQLVSNVLENERGSIHFRNFLRHQVEEQLDSMGSSPAK